MLKLDLIQTVALSGVVLFFGHGVRRLVPLLAKCNIPAPVVGGLIMAFGLTLARAQGVTLLEFDKTLERPLMTAFFTSVGFGASVALLKKGGPPVVVFLVLATIMAVAQNLLGGGLAWLLGTDPLLGVLAGSVALTGGPGTALAFAPLFESAGVTGAGTLGFAAAMLGIVAGGLIGGPIGTFLIERRKLRTPRPAAARVGVERAEHVVERMAPEAVQHTPPREDVEAYGLLKHLVLILVAMWAGHYVSALMTSPSFTLPAYIGAMLVAAALRNLDEATGWLGISQRVIDDLGSMALSLFLALALMTLRVWEIGALAGPMLVIVAAQVVLVAVVCLWAVPWLMGRDYEGAVISSGFCGFMLGTTANAMANMEALVQRYGSAPKAFLIVPIVGAFLIDFTNGLIITGFVNTWR